MIERIDPTSEFGVEEVNTGDAWRLYDLMADWLTHANVLQGRRKDAAMVALGKLGDALEAGQVRRWRDPDQSKDTFGTGSCTG